jgi:hypothetical protein
VEQYERANNYIAAAEGWTVVAVTILQVAQREELPTGLYQPALNLVWTVLERNIRSFEREVLDRSHFVEPRFVLAKPMVYKIRVTIILSWLAASALIRRTLGQDIISTRQMLSVIQREARNFQITGEADWPGIVAIALYLEYENGTHEVEHLIGTWLDAIIHANTGKEPRGIPSPYWLHEKIIQLSLDELPPHERETFAHHSYTALSALDILVRRLCRQRVSALWSRISKTLFCDFVPDHAAGWFLWRCKEGALHITDHKQPVSWSAWRSKVTIIFRREAVPEVLLRHPEKRILLSTGKI